MSLQRSNFHRIVPTGEVHRQIIVLVREVAADIARGVHIHEVTNGLLAFWKIVERIVCDYLREVRAEVGTHHGTPLSNS